MKAQTFNNIAYAEYYLTKNKSAFSLSNPHTTKQINQYYSRSTFEDGSSLLISSCHNKVNLNVMVCVTPCGIKQAIRTLF